MRRVPALAARLCLWSLLALSVVPSPAWALARLPSSPPSSWIYDGASLLSASARSDLAARKQQLEEETGARLVVVTLSSADGEAPKAIAVRALNMWNAGRRSAVLLVLMSPRELYIQPGTELASLLDGATSSAICSGVVAPKMRSGDPAAALRAGLDAMASRISSGSGASSARTEEDILPTAQARGSAVPLQRYGESAESTSSGSGSWAWLGWVLGLSGLGGGIWGLSLLFAKKCTECGKRMTKSSRTISQPTTLSTGEGEHTYSCGSCGYTFAETYIISQIVESTTSSTDSHTSHSSWSSSSSDSSWSSSSSDSSSSSSSSDSSGGGGSTW